jgi:biopolymer transport protein ExbB/TolQ
MNAIIDKPFGLLMVFSSLLGIELFFLYLLVDWGLLPTLLAEDYSFISRAVLSIYLLASLHVMLVAYHFSIENREVNADASTRPCGSNVQHYLSQLHKPASDSDTSPELLIEVLEGRCRGQFKFGYVVADLMLKLGLLGTVIGFIFMLGSLVDLHSIDITVMQKLLAQMSGGMKVALFTTLTGMSCGVLLNMKYQLLDWSVDKLLDDVRELTYEFRAN